SLAVVERACIACIGGRKRFGARRGHPECRVVAEEAAPLPLCFIRPPRPPPHPLQRTRKRPPPPGPLPLAPGADRAEIGLANTRTGCKRRIGAHLQSHRAAH